MIRTSTPVATTQIISNIALAGQSPRQVAREFRRLLRDGVPLKPAGYARDDPWMLPETGYTPKYSITLFDVTYYLTNLRFDDHLGFFVAYVLMKTPAGEPEALYPRLFYKDNSLVWRSATHYVDSDHDTWIGKGALKETLCGGDTWYGTAEETTNLPLEIQSAIDDVARRGPRPRRDNSAVGLVLRQAPEGRAAPYRDFTDPRRRTGGRSGGLINRGKPVVFFDRPGEPSSLRFAPGFEPDFRRGFLGAGHLASKTYGGPVSKYRFLSRNRQVHYQFVAAPRHVWIIPPQALTTDISSYGVRTVDVLGDEDAFVPGFEYHFLEDDTDPSSLHSQIPAGYAGAPSAVDPSRADASAWLDGMPVVKAFRRWMRRAETGRG